MLYGWPQAHQNVPLTCVGIIPHKESPHSFAWTGFTQAQKSPRAICHKSLQKFSSKSLKQTSSILRNAVDGLCLTGSEIGNIYLWKREEQIDMVVAAHKGPVYAISTFINGFVSGGKDGKVGGRKSRVLSGHVCAGKHFGDCCAGEPCSEGGVGVNLAETFGASAGTDLEQ